MNSRRMFAAALAALMLLGLATSARAATVPTVSTNLALDITAGGATLGGTVSDNGGSALTDRGVVVCEDPCTPTVGMPGSMGFDTGPGGTGVFSRVVPLKASTWYDFRAWASNGAGIAYGGTGTFHTHVNSAPAPKAGGPYTIDEGGSLHLNASASSDADGDALTYTWDVDGDGTFGDATGVQPTLTWTQLAALGLDGPADRIVTVRVSDGTNPAVTAQATLHVDNVKPAATLDAPATAAEGTPVTLSVTSPSDPSPADAIGLHYAFDTDGDGTWDVGDGTYAGGVTAHTTAFTAPDGPATRTVRMRVIDRDGGFTDVTRQIAIANADPTASLALPATADEGSAVTASLTGATDQAVGDRGSLRYAIDIGDDGTYELGGATYATSSAQASTTFTAESGSVKVRAIVRDKDGGASAYTGRIDVANLAPAATLSADGPVDEGSPAHVSFSGATDASAGDTAAGFHYAFDVDGDGIYDIGNGTYLHSPATPAAAVPTSDDGTTTVTAAIIDRDGGITRRTVDVVARDVAPDAAITAPESTPAGTPLAFALSAADPSSADTAAGFAYAVDWGDGSTGTNGSHTYAAPGTYTVSVTATDKDGATGPAAELDVTIAARPAVTPVPPAVVTPPAPPVAPSAKLSGLRAAPRCTRTTTKLRYTLDIAASVRVTIGRKAGGRAFGSCPATQPRKAHQHGVYKRVRTLTAAGRAGANAQPLLTRLQPGTYLVTAEALDASGRVVSHAQVNLWILRKRTAADH